MISRRVACLLLVALCAVLSAPSAGASAGARSKRLHVSGNRLLDARGHVVHLHGVNRSGTEYACIQGWGIFDGPSDSASVAAIASWHANIVRVPVNEDCWLGINGVKPAYAGRNYIRAILDRQRDEFRKEMEKRGRKRASVR